MEGIALHDLSRVDTEMGQLRSTVNEYWLSLAHDIIHTGEASSNPPNPKQFGDTVGSRSPALLSEDPQLFEISPDRVDSTELCKRYVCMWLVQNGE